MFQFRTRVVDDHPTQLNFEQLAVLFSKIVGSGTLVFTASTLSASLTVPHQLGVVPSAIICTAAGVLSGTYSPVTLAVSEGSETAAQFVVQGQTSAAITRNVKFYWLAFP